MAFIEKDDAKTYAYILSSDGSLRQNVEEGTPGAVRRDWEAPGGKTGTKWELVYNGLSGMVEGISIHDGDYGKNILVKFDDGIILSLSTTTNYGEDFMQKINNIDFGRTVTIKPYAFENEKGKTLKGVTILQDGEKVVNYYADPLNNVALHGYPEPSKKCKEKGDKDLWKAFFAEARVFLIEELEKHPMVVKSLEDYRAVPVTEKYKYPEAVIQTEEAF